MRVPQIAVQRQDRVAIGEEHLAVGDPHGVVPEGFRMAEEADLVDVGHDADAEAHVSSSSGGPAR